MNTYTFTLTITKDDKSITCEGETDNPTQSIKDATIEITSLLDAKNKARKLIQ